MPRITSFQNPHVKNAVRLRDRRHREKQGRTLIDGARELCRAIDAGVGLVEVFVCEPLCRSQDARQLLPALGSLDIPVYSVSESIFAKLAFGERAEGVLGVAAVPEATLDRLPLAKSPIIGVLESVEKPGNVGAVLRSADGAGLSALIVADPMTDLYNPNAIRASLGTIFTMPVASATAAEAFHWLRRHGLAIFAARVDGSIAYTEADLCGPAAIVLGSEAQGLSAVWSGPEVTAIRLPMRGAADSLNVSAAAAVLFYEALRQRENL